MTKKYKEHKGHQERDCPEHSHCPPREKSRGYDELLHRIGRLVTRIERVEDEARCHSLVRDDEGPPVAAKSVILAGPKSDGARRLDRNPGRQNDPAQQIEFLGLALG